MPAINGVAYDGGCIEMRLGTSAFEIDEAGHEEEIDSKKIGSLGSDHATSDTPGYYEAKDDTIKVETGVWAQILAKLPANGYGHVRFPITIDYVHPDLGTMHVVKERCRILGVKGTFKTGSDAAMTELKIRCMQIKINGKTLNKLKGTGTTDADNTLKL